MNRLRKFTVQAKESETQEKYEKLTEEYNFLTEVITEAKEIYALMQQANDLFAAHVADGNLFQYPMKIMEDGFFNDGSKTYTYYTRLQQQLNNKNKQLTKLKDERTVEFWNQSASTIMKKMKKVILADSQQLTIEDAEVQINFDEIDSLVNQIHQRMSDLSDKIQSSYLTKFEYVSGNAIQVLKWIEKSIESWENVKNQGRYQQQQVQKLEQERYE